MIRSCGISHVRLVIMIGRAATVLLLAGGSSAALRAPVAPALDGYPLTRGLGLLPSFRRDSVGCLAAHAQHCRQSGLDAVAMDMGLLGRFTMITGPEQLAFLLEDRQNIFYKSAIDRRGVGLLTGIGVLLADEASSAEDDASANGVTQAAPESDAEGTRYQRREPVPGTGIASGTRK